MVLFSSTIKMQQLKAGYASQATTCCLVQDKKTAKNCG